MRGRNALGVAVLFLTVAVFGVGCGSQEPTPVPPTVTPTTLPPTPTFTPAPPTFTPAPTSVSGPKPGRWRGDKASFTVTTEGSITEFEIAVMDCRVSIEDEVPVDLGGSFASFTINPEGAFHGKNAEAGTDLSAVATFETETTLVGTYTVQICGGSLFFNQADVVWTSEWQQP